MRSERSFGRLEAASPQQGLPAAPRGRGASPEISRLVELLPRRAAHLVVASPNVSPDAILDPIVDGLLPTGRVVRVVRPEAMPVHIHDILILREPGLPPRQLQVELGELGRRARHDGGTIIVRWQMQTEADTACVRRMREAADWVIRVHDPEFDVPPEIVPTHYRIPVEVFQGNTRVVSFPVHEAVKPGAGTCNPKSNCVNHRSMAGFRLPLSTRFGQVATTHDLPLMRIRPQGWSR